MKRGDNVKNLNNDKTFGGVEIDNTDNLILDSYTPPGTDHPIVERTTNALLWPEQVKGGIDLNDTDIVTQVPVIPRSYPESIKK
jgi:hypothetical protein